MHVLHQNHVKYGLIMCGILAICLTLMELTGAKTFDQKSPIFAFSQFIAPAFVWYFGIRERKKAQNNKLTFKQGLNEGFKISLVFAVVSPFIFVLYYLLFNPSIIEYVRSSYGMNDASDTIVILVDMLVQFISAIIFGTIYGAVIALFLKKK